MKVLLALSTTRHSEKAIDAAIQRASVPDGTLVVLFILDDEVPSRLYQQLTDRGFIGEKPSDSISNAIMKEYRHRAEEEANRIVERAKQQGVRCEVEIVRGPFAEESLNGVLRHQADLIILTRMKRSNLARFLLGSAVNNLRAQCPCPVEIIDE